MYHKDYILRMIEMLGELIAGILGCIRKGKFEEAEQAIEDAYYQLLKEDSAFFQSIPKEELTSKLLQEHHYTHGHLEILSELFYTEAELAYAQGKKKDSLVFYEKALLLVEFVVKESKTFSMEKEEKIKSIKNMIKNLESNPLN